MACHFFNSRDASKHNRTRQSYKFHTVFLNTIQDLESDEPTISYTKNGEDLGVAFKLSKEELAEKVLFPHISIKNTECQINTGAQVCYEKRMSASEKR